MNKKVFEKIDSKMADAKRGMILFQNDKIEYNKYLTVWNNLYSLRREIFTPAEIEQFA